MKYSAMYAFLSLVVLSGCASSRPLYVAPTDLWTENIKGSVKTIRHRDLEVLRRPESDPNRKKDFDSYYVMEYNRTGNMTSRESYFGTDSIPNNIDTYTYDPSGINVVSSRTYYPAAQEFMIYKYILDGQGRPTQESDAVNSYTTSHIYDPKGYPVADVTIRDKDTKDSLYYRYNSCGQRIEGGGSAT